MTFSRHSQAAELRRLRRRGRQRVRSIGEHYRTVLESMDEGFCVIEVLFDEVDNPMDFRFLEVNPAFEKQTGIQHAVGQRIREIAATLEEHWFRIYGRIARTGESVRFENPAMALGRYFDVFAFRIGNPKDRRVAILFNDITDRKQAEAERERLLGELCAAQKQLNADVDGLNRLLKIGSLFLEDGNLKSILGEILDTAIAITEADFGTFQLLGSSGDLEIVAHRGFPQWWLDYWNSVIVGQGACGTALGQKKRVIVDDVQQSPIFVGTPALQIQLDAGVRAVQSTPIIGRSGQPLGMFSTHFKAPMNLNDRQERLLDLLSRQVADMLEWVQGEKARLTNERLAEADRHKNEFLGMLSHELRNPLSAIRNAAHVLDRAAPASEQAQRAHAVIHRQVDQLTRLIEDLLDITRLTRGKIRFQCELLDLNELTQRAVEDQRAVFDASGVELRMQAPPSAIWVSADRTRLSQAIGNLLQNAVKFTPRGGKTTVSMEQTDGQVEIHVQDTGVGIMQEMLPRLFEPFSQADVTLTRSRGGLGLGLAVVKGLLQLHGGAAIAESDGPGKGATFTISLPLVQAAVPELSAPRASGPKTTRRVLIIEDNQDAADTLRGLLEIAGHVIDVAADGDTGIEKARTFKPEVVLCDIGLPGIDGYDVVRTLRADPAMSRIKYVALSGYAQDDDVAKALAAGFDVHLAKPPNLEALEQILTEHGSPCL